MEGRDCGEEVGDGDYQRQRGRKNKDMQGDARFQFLKWGHILIIWRLEATIRSSTT